MLDIRLSDEQVKNEIIRIRNHITSMLSGRDKVCIAISGGLDCDVVARLVKGIPEVKKFKLFTVLQHDMDKKHLQNARELAKDMDEELIEIPLEDDPFNIMKGLDAADPNEKFCIDGLDAMRMKCSLRTSFFSIYQDHGYIVLGTTNRTEFETGFFLPFGDGIAHIKPILHLYKTQVRQLAKELGTRKAVLDQPASAGFWQGEEDLEDLAWWLFNEAPIVGELISTKEEDLYVDGIYKQLTTEKVDQILFGLYKSIEPNIISEEVNVSIDIVQKFVLLLNSSRSFKHYPLNRSIESF